VIERPTDGILDVNGWDVRKLLQLLVRSNAVVLEWLTSSIRYRDGGPIAAQLLALARETCYLPALAYHYDRLARNSFGEITSSPGAVRFRAYCYALRPALALLWVRRGEAPPMDLWSLLAGVAIPEALRHTVAELVEREAAAVLARTSYSGRFFASRSRPTDRGDTAIPRPQERQAAGLGLR
jgi:predicted nucleotidyltransferase